MAGPVPGPVGAAAGCPAHGGGPGETRTKEHQMTSNARGCAWILGSLRSADGKGVVRMEDRFDTDIDDLWSALTDPRRLARWIGEAELAADGSQTVLVVEERGMPLDLLAAYGAGVQIHLENLAAHLAGRERCDAETRWNELIPAYRDLA